MLLADTQGLPSRTANPSPHTLSFSLCFSLTPSLSLSSLTSVQSFNATRSPPLHVSAKKTFQTPSLWPPINQSQISHLHTHHPSQLTNQCFDSSSLSILSLTIWQTVKRNGRSQRRVKCFYWLYCVKPWVGSPCCWRSLISFHSCEFQRRRCSCLGQKGCSLWVNTFHMKVLDSFYAFFPHLHSSACLSILTSLTFLCCLSGHCYLLPVELLHSYRCIGSSGKPSWR